MGTDPVQNRMGEEPDLEGVRATFRKPTFWERTGQRWLSAIRSSTGLTVILFITILVVIGLGYWLLT